MIYAGFWKRLCAYYIDAIILYILSYIGFLVIMLLFSMPMAAVLQSDAMYRQSFEEFLPLLVISTFLYVLILSWFYYALMEMSPTQGTLGKMALGIIVTDERFERVTFGRATGRFFGRIVSSLILYVGFLIIPFTSKKQGLHDRMAGTCVVDKKVLLLAKQFGLDVHQPPFVQHQAYNPIPMHKPVQPPMAPFEKE